VATLRDLEAGGNTVTNRTWDCLTFSLMFINDRAVRMGLFP
jgi:hypothetical protein